MADLTTLTKVKRYIFGNEPALDSDEVLSDLITSSSAWVERQIGKRYDTHTVTEPRDGDGTTRMVLEQTPTADVTSVTVDGVIVPKRTAVDGEGWVYADGAVDLVGYVFTRGVQNIVFVYTAGETVPADVEQAVIRHVALSLFDRNREGLASSSGDGSATFSPGATLAFIQGVIDLHRELVIT
jgi:hypothetical protein